MSYSVKKSDTVLEYNTQTSGNAAVYLKIVDINNRNSDANASWLISSMHVYVNDKEVQVRHWVRWKIQRTLRIITTICCIWLF